MLRVWGRRFNRKALQDTAYELRAPPAIFYGNGSSKPWICYSDTTSVVTLDLAASDTRRDTQHRPSMEASTASAVMTSKKVAHNDTSTRFFSSVQNSKYGGHVISTHVASTSSMVLRTCHLSLFSYGPNSWARTAVASDPSPTLLVRYSSSANVEDQANAEHEGSGQGGEEVPKPERTQDSQHEEIMGFMVERDISAVANELRQAQKEMLVNMKKCYRALFAVGTVHLIWGLVTFSALEWPHDQAIMIEICMSGLVFCALAYQMKQTIRPVQFFTNLEEQLKIVFLSRQVSRMLGAFFHRGSGIGFVLGCTLAAHALSCIRFLL